MALEPERFQRILDAVSINDECERCYYFNPTMTNPGQGYRCRCMGSCPAATLSSDMVSYLWWKLGVLTEKQHRQNVEAGHICR